MSVQRRDGVDAFSVDYRTQAGTATPGSDYTEVSGSLTWAAGDGRAQLIEVPITVDGNSGEAEETVQLLLENPVGGPLGLSSIELRIAEAANSAPQAEAGSDRTVDPGTVVQLDASASSDPDGDPLTFIWSQTAGPPVSLIGNGVQITFTAPQVSSDTLLRFQVEVSDTAGAMDTDSVQVTVRGSGSGGGGGGGGGSGGLWLLLAAGLALTLRKGDGREGHGSI